MKYKVESSWFPGDYGSWNKPYTEFDVLEEAVVFIKLNAPPPECEWNIKKDKKLIAFTKCYYNEFFIWEDGKLIKKKLRE